MGLAARDDIKKMQGRSRFYHLIGRHMSVYLRVLGMVFSLIGLAGYSPSSLAAEGDKLNNQEYLVGDSLYRQLQSPLTVSWKRVEFRQVLDQLSETTHISLVADRQLDPRRLITLEADQKPLYLILFEVARQSGAELSVQANYVFVGIPRNARLLRTMIARKQEEMSMPGLEPIAGSRERKGRTGDLQWEKLTTPQELLREIGANFTLEMTNPEEIPHDLLAAGCIPRANLEQQLCTLLIQYDFSYEWVEPGKKIKIVPSPRNFTIEQIHRVPTTRRDALSAELGERGVAAWEWVGENRLRVVGRVEDHEWVTSQTKAPRKSDTSPTENEMALGKRRFTIKQEGVAVMSVIEQLRKLGIEIEFDPAEFAENLAERKDKTDLDLREATPEELCAQLFAQSPVQYEVLRDKIVLRPAE